MKNLLFSFTIAFFFTPYGTVGQEYYSSDLTTKVYTDLRIALNDRDRVYRLDLSEKNLFSLPLEVYKLENLEVLILDGNSISSLVIPPNKLPNLQYLSLKRNNIRTFRLEKNCLDKLTELYLDQNELLEFPLISNVMVNLLTLSLAQNYIKELPNKALYLSELKHLTLNDNPLSNPEVAFSYSSYLERLSMYKTGLSKLPNTYKFKSLKKLVISGNQLEFNSIDGGNFFRVEYLDISYNKMDSDIDFKGVTTFSSVKYLVAEDIGMKTLVPEINLMKKLREVSFLRNQLQKLPEEIYELKLKSLHLEFNPIAENEKNEIQKNLPKTTIYFK